VQRESPTLSIVFNAGAARRHLLQNIAACGGTFSTPVPSPGATGRAGLTGLTRQPRLSESDGGQA